ncbi:hypothetical protein MtrunA17_Chr7g0215191 [Medicago truncatula]|uniref:Uncharacterized protein n=1 Tax=Medicago truncatula TaxID=3880 RepID=A0A396GSD8_MEDTR|nr:hypothetical protein MtrunA17_Chr7g0215191 [Medicago truncatula]
MLDQDQTVNISNLVFNSFKKKIKIYLLSVPFDLDPTITDVIIALTCEFMSEVNSTP